MSAVELILERLDGPKQSGDTWSARCPAHEDRSPSLTVSSRAKGDPGAVVHCFAGCTPEAVVGALGLTPADLFDQRHQGEPETVYTYRDAEGAALFDVVRKPGKQFYQRPANGKRGPGAMSGVPLVLYRLPELLAGIAGNGTVFVVEGEKDADRLAAEGYVTTTNPQGAGKWSKVADHAREVLKGADVWIVADKDDPGRRHAADVARSLDGHAGSIKVVEAAKGKDMSDHLAAGLTVDDLVPADVDSDPPPDAEGDTLTSLRARLLTIDQLGQLPPPRPLVAGVLDVDNTSIIYGRRGAYKSFLALDMALSIASGIDWHAHATTPGVVVYVVAEGVSGVHQRIAAWLHCHRGADPGDRLLILPEPVNLLADEQVHTFALGCHEVGAVFVVLDTLARCLVGGDENSARDMGIAVASLDTIRRATGANVNAVHHSGKDAKAGARGSSALEAGVETVLEVGAADDIVTVRTTKQKNRPEGSPIMFDVTPSGPSIILARRHRPEYEVTDKAREVIAILHDIAGDIGSTFTPWVDACGEAGISKTTVRRVRVKALNERWIGHGPNSSDKTPRYIVTDAGRAIAHPEGETDDDQG